MKKKVLFSISLCSVLALSGCVSEQSYVGSDKPVSDRTFDNIEAARTRISLGLNYLRRGDTSQAKYNLERARSFAPNSAEVYSALAYYYQNVGEAKQAETYFRQAISKDSNYADAYNNYGAFLCQLKRYDEAEQLLLKAISRPGYIRVAESYENLSLCQLQQNNFTKAKTYLDNSIGHNTTRISSLTMAAALDYAMGDNKQAKAQLDRIQRLGRVSARTVLLSYLLAEKSGDRETMRSAEQLLLTLYTETPETRLLLQGKLQDSEFEQLRERYKDSLMANIVVPDGNAAQPDVPLAPQPNPKLKIVKRKNADDTVSPGSEDKVAVASDAAAVLSNSAAAITNSLDSAKQSIVKPALAAEALPAETVMAVEPQVTQTVEAETATASEQLATADAELVAELAAEKTTDDKVQPATELPSAADIDAFVAQNSAEAKDNNVMPQQQDNNLQQDGADSLNVENDKVTKSIDAIADTDSVTVESSEQSLAVEAEQSEPADSVLAQIDVAEATEDTAAEGNADIVKTGDEQTATVVSEPVSEPDSTAYHIVQASESLYSISVKHNIRLQRIMQWNQLSPDSVIKTGQKIWLEPVTEMELAAPVITEPALKEREQVVATEPYHTVVAGETMFGISYKYNVRLSSFMQWNNLTESSKLHVGQKVLVVDPDNVAQ